MELKEAETGEPLPDAALLDQKIDEATKAMEDAQTNAEKRKAKERKEDLMRLKRAEQIYVSHIITYLPPLIAKLSVGIRLPSFPQYQVGSLYYSSSYLQLFLQARICRSLNPLPPLSFLPGYHVLAFF